MTVYLSGYDHDIFVSYVHQDQLGEWTESLREELGKALNLILFLKPPAELVDVWIDERLRLNLPLNDELKCRIEKSALLLVVMSPLYLRSDWCEKEATWFATAVKERAFSDRRVFVVQAFPTDRAKWPAPISRLPGYRFFGRHPVAQQDLPLGLIGDKDDEVAFKQALYNLAGQIKTQLDELKNVSTALEARAFEPMPPPPVQTNSSRLVCLETIGDTTPNHLDAVQYVRRILKDHNVDIFTPTELGDPPRDPVGAERYLQRLTMAKANCDGLILLRLDPTIPAADWVLDYICEIRPLARRVRTESSDQLPLIVDVGSGAPTSAPKEIQLISTSDSEQFEKQLQAWIACLSPARQETRK